MGANITVLLVDGHALFREGLRALLERQEGLAVVGEVADANNAVEQADALCPDVILVGLPLPAQSQAEAIAAIIRRQATAAIIAISFDQDPQHLAAAILAGARGYLRKDAGTAALVQGIRTVAAGGAALDPQVGLMLFEVLRRLTDGAAPRSAMDAVFTRRELDIVELLTRGRNNQQIGATLHISEQTVKNALTAIYHKLGVQNRTEAVLAVLQRGVVDSGSHAPSDEAPRLQSSHMQTRD